MAGLVTKTLGRTAERVPGLRRIPIVRLLAIGEIAVLARDHITRLDPGERRRLLVLLRNSHGRPSNLSARQHRELESLIAKLEPRLFAGAAMDKISPVSLPDRVLYGRSSKGRKGRRK